MILSCVYVYIGAHVFKYGDDLLVTLRGGEIESGQGDVSSKCSAGEPEGCVGPVALYRGAGRFDILLIACYFIYDESIGIPVFFYCYSESSQYVHGQIHIAGRFECCCELECAVPVKQRKCEEQSGYEL